jgi:zinc/manganese transport system permease protein
MNIVRDLFEFQFMVNAFRAGSVIAILAGAVGWFMVLRRQTFAGHTLALIGFPGAAGAVLVGLSAQLGFFAFCVGGALVIAAVPAQRPGRFSEESAVIAVVQTFALACGFLFASLYRGNLSRINSLLFGTFLGITTTEVRTLVVVTTAALAVLAFIARPLLFASVDPDVADAAGVPARGLAIVFLILLGAAAAEASQITGSLLIFALLVLPPATAQAITSRPVLGLALSIGIGLLVTWTGLGIAYYSPYPIGFWITSIAFGLFVVARVAGHVPRRRLRVAS